MISGGSTGTQVHKYKEQKLFKCNMTTHLLKKLPKEGRSQSVNLLTSIPKKTARLMKLGEIIPHLLQISGTVMTVLVIVIN